MKKTTEQFIEDSKKRFGDRFDYSLCNYINNKTKVILICKKHNNKFETEPKIHLFKKGGCKLCATESRRKASKLLIKSNEQFIKDSKEKFGDKYDYSKCEYTGAVNNIILLCKECGNEFAINAHGHLRTIDGGCKNCAVKKVSETKRITQDEIIEKCKKRSDKYDYSKIKYIDAYTKIEIVCKKHGSFWMLPYNFYGNKQDCPKCFLSKMEEKVSNYLKNKNIFFETQKTFDDLIDTRKLSYDFYIPSRNLLIECQGEQHYRPVNIFGGIKQFRLQLHHDWMKRKYARDNNIKLLAIPYWEDVDKILSVL